MKANSIEGQSVRGYQSAFDMKESIGGLLGNNTVQTYKLKAMEYVLTEKTSQLYGKQAEKENLLVELSSRLK